MDLPAKRRADDGPTSNAGLAQLYFFRRSGPVLLNTLYFCDFPGEGGGRGLDPNITLREPS